jgi:hypothetical protein
MMRWKVNKKDLKGTVIVFECLMVLALLLKYTANVVVSKGDVDLI